MVQLQRFEFERLIDGTWQNKDYLLIPSEVVEFHRLTGPGIEFTFNQAFERITGKEVDATIRNIRLVVEVLDCGEARVII